MKKQIKSVVRKLLSSFGYQVCRISDSSDNSSSTFTMKSALFRLAGHSPSVRTVIDVGASNGSWSHLCQRYYPHAHYHLIEAQEFHRKALSMFSARHKKNVTYRIAAASDRVGSIFFDISDPLGGVASESPGEGEWVETETTTVDTEVVQNRLKPPFILKLDTHGHEIPILRGADSTLKEAKAVIIEAYTHKLTNQGVRFFELCNWMEQTGFLPVDVVDLMLRPKDMSLWQMDIVFIRHDSPLFLYNNYE